MDWIAVIYYLALMAVMIAGFAISLIGLPGLWLMLAGLIGYALLTGWGVYLGWPGILVVLVLILLAEVLEFILGGAASKQAGGSTRSAIGALVGGLLGALFLSLPLPIIGTIIGACAGSFIGALIAEFTVGADAARSTRVGYAAAKGRLWGSLTKMAFGVVVLLVGGIVAVPLGAARSTPPATAPAPGTTQQAS